MKCSFFVYEYSEKEQAGGKEFLVGFAVILALLRSFAAALSAHKAHLTAPAAFGNSKAFLYEAFCRFGFFHCGKISFKNIAEKIFVRAVEVAGVNITVGFRYKLMRAMSRNSALLRRLTKK